MQIKTMLFTAAVGFLCVGNAEARQPTFDEVMAVHKVLQGDNCDYVYLGMGERELYVTEGGYEAVAKCADGATYLYQLDGNYSVLKKAAKQG